MSKFLLIADAKQDYSLFPSTLSNLRLLISNIMNSGWDLERSPRVLFTSNKCCAVAEDIDQSLMDTLQTKLRIPNLIKPDAQGQPRTIPQSDLVSDIMGSKDNLVVVVTDYPKVDVIYDVAKEKKHSVVFPDASTSSGIHLYNITTGELLL